MNKIDTKDWKEFKLEDLGFTLFHGTRITKLDRVEGNIIFLTAGKENIGVIGTIGNEVDLWNKPITVDMFGNCFYHNCICSGDDNVYAFVNDTISDNCKRFIASCINAKTAHLFSYKEQFRQNNAATLSVYLPTKEDKPNWNYMEDYIKNLEDRVKDTLDKFSQKNTSEKIDTRDWKEFKVGDLFDLIAVKNKMTNLDLDDNGTVPVYSSTTDNNGVIGYTDKDADYRTSKEVPFYLIFGDHTKSMFIAKEDFCVADNIKVLQPKVFNEEVIRFVSVSWGASIPNLGYARHWSIAKDSIFYLPVNNNEEPDWLYMENFMKSIEQKSKQKLDLLQVTGR